MRLVWTTDPHLNHVPVQAWDRWVELIRGHRPDAVVITGDISEGDDVAFQLQRIAEAFGVPIYFVLGNHDFYQSSIALTRQRVIDVSRETPLLHYLTDQSGIEIGDGIFMVGDDGWGDATIGDYEGSTIRLNDFQLIDDFRLADPSRWKGMLQKQGQQSADRLDAKFDTLPQSARHVLLVTHVPPFREACWYEGHTTDDNWAPFFVCGAVGESLQRAQRSRPDCRLTVLCGHTHHEGIAEIRPNLIVHTGAADYGHPDIEAVIEIGDDGLSVSSTT